MKVTGESSEEFILKLQSEFKQAKAKGQLSDLQKITAQSYSPDLEETGLANFNPCRVITIRPTVDSNDQEVRAQVSASCPINKQGNHILTCCEYITLQGSADALEKVSDVISDLNDAYQNLVRKDSAA